MDSNNRAAGMAEQFMSSWKSDVFRSRCVKQIETVRSQTKPQVDSADHLEAFLGKNNSEQLEEFVFKQSNTREEYMSLITDMLMMLRQHAGKSLVDMSVLEKADPSVLQAAGISEEEVTSLAKVNGGGDGDGEKTKKKEEEKEEDKDKK